MAPPFKRTLCAFCDEPVTPACKCQRRHQLTSKASLEQKNAIIDDCALHLELQGSLIIGDDAKQKHYYEAAAELRKLTKPKAAEVFDLVIG